MLVVKKQPLLLCTLLICNTATMKALPIFLDSLVSVLSMGVAMASVVRVLVCVCFPVAYPISKLLDYLVGEGRVALFHRAELKTLIRLQGNETGKGGELTCDELTGKGGERAYDEKAKIKPS